MFPAAGGSARKVHLQRVNCSACYLHTLAQNVPENHRCKNSRVQPDCSLPDNLNKQRILDYLKAGYAGDIERAASYYDDDIDFIGYAPIDVFPTLGQKSGKAAMIQTLVRLHSLYRRVEYDVASTIAEDDRVAVILELRMFAREDDRVIRLPLANFYTLRNGRIYIYRQFLDSFDAVQQRLRRDLLELVSLAPARAEGTGR